MTSTLKFLNFSQTSFQTKEKHHFHLVDNSQLPIITAFASMLLVLNIVFYLHPSDVPSFRFLDNMMFQAVWFKLTRFYIQQVISFRVFSMPQKKLWPIKTKFSYNLWNSFGFLKKEWFKGFKNETN